LSPKTSISPPSTIYHATIYHGFQTVLRIHADRRGLETLVFTIPGILAANGLNSRSVGVCVNAVTQLSYSPEGLPIEFVVRGILRQGFCAEPGSAAG
jgi:hypothetical protein